MGGVREAVCARSEDLQQGTGDGEAGRASLCEWRPLAVQFLAGCFVRPMGWCKMIPCAFLCIFLVPSELSISSEGWPPASWSPHTVLFSWAQPACCPQPLAWAAVTAHMCESCLHLQICPGNLFLQGPCPGPLATGGKRGASAAQPGSLQGCGSSLGKHGIYTQSRPVTGHISDLFIALAQTSRTCSSFFIGGVGGEGGRSMGLYKTQIEGNGYVVCRL